MKKFNLLALALVISTASLFAANVENPSDDAPAKSIRADIVKMLATPDFSLDDDQTVNVTFTFNTEGKLIVLKIDSNNRDVRNYIAKNLNQKKFDNPGTINKIYTVPLRMTK